MNRICILFSIVPILKSIPTSDVELNDFSFGDETRGEPFDDQWYLDYYGPVTEMRVWCDHTLDGAINGLSVRYGPRSGSNTYIWSAVRGTDTGIKVDWFISDPIEQVNTR